MYPESYSKLTSSGRRQTGGKEGGRRRERMEGRREEGESREEGGEEGKKEGREGREGRREGGRRGGRGGRREGKEGPREEGGNSESCRDGFRVSCVKTQHAVHFKTGSA